VVKQVEPVDAEEEKKGEESSEITKVS